MHDKVRDNYGAFSTLKALSDKTKIPYNTLINHFTRLKNDRYTTRAAIVIIKVELLKNWRK